MLLISCNTKGNNEDGDNVLTGPVELVVKQENKYAMVENTSRMFVEIDLNSLEDISKRGKLPLNVSIVIDRSGSMLEEGKLEYVKEAVSYFVNKLGDDDTLSIITYSDKAEVLIEQGPVLSEDIITEKLSTVRGSGWTNLSDGIEKAFRQIMEVRDTDEINRIILLSDGLANRGITDMEGLSALSEDVFSKDISISTIGVGADYDEDILRSISERGAGNYYYIAKTSQIPDIYENELISLFNTIAKDATLSIRLVNGAVLKNLFGYDYKPVSQNMYKIELGSLSAGIDRWVILEIETPYREKEGELNLGTVWLGYNKAGDDGKGKEYKFSEDINVEFTDNYEKVEEGRDKDVINVAMYIIAQQAKKDAQRYLREGDLFAASDILKQQNLYIESKYEETGAMIPGSIMSEMEQNKDDADLLFGGVSGEGLSDETLSTKSKELDYENYEKTRKKQDID
jgi:Ca-activated chloride channel family protein